MSSEVWTWRDNVLLDPQGREVALFRSGVIHMGIHHILTEIQRSEMKLAIAATTSKGEVFSLAQDGFSIGRLSANCGGRRYRLDRVHRFRRERLLKDSEGHAFARTCPAGASLEVFDHPQDCAVPDLDFIFLTWACKEADNPTRLYT
ncbi:hypothetical protein CPHO_03560 [Corynebacterium phocae]|uniref:Uncharacterized protein n=1 Tax=Corynebacterium phocae TaxID=161895 RepID=A0A1L7D268_9CORY|nr:hypothetical protein [Corynebacterium phocae]APT92122.1 hypothetical protein CPHO_03560 [Corynebacterium phocae]KAA8726509.1 hypothetical protein F4V58_03115 [Corynebacterium phocae]